MTPTQFSFGHYGKTVVATDISRGNFSYYHRCNIIWMLQGNWKGSSWSHFAFHMVWPIFLIANPKFELQIFCSFGDMTKSVKLNGIPENNLCIFITASSPGVHTFFCLWRINKKLPQGKTSQNALQRSRSIN